MINFIYESVSRACKETLGIDVEFKRVPEKSQPMAPTFLIVTNGKPTNILFNTAAINEANFSTSEFIPRLINSIVLKIAGDYAERK